MSDAAPKSTLRMAVLYGGRSAEHDVSVLSATNVMRALAPGPYEPLPIFITRAGRWLLASFEDGRLSQPDSGTEVCLIPGGCGRMIAIPADGIAYALPKIDLLFPVLHGLHGEDGSVQGLAEVARVPLVGCGILGSATALDKDIAKRLLQQAGLTTAASITLHAAASSAFADAASELGLPIFVKPARQGSSVGVSKVETAAEWEAALKEGFKHDRKLLAEAFIRGREIECSVLEDEAGGLFVSRPGEIMPAASHAFYSYEAKYIDADGATLNVPADVPPEVESKLRAMAGAAFKALGCDGMARVDFFVTADLHCLVNEVNTIPGFTDISMYPKAMAASGVSYAEIIDRLVKHGLARAGR